MDVYVQKPDFSFQFTFLLFSSNSRKILFRNLYPYFFLLRTLSS